MKYLLALGYLLIFQVVMGQTPAFEVYFLQNNKVIPIEKHQVKLAKDEFSIVISIQNAEGIYLNASFDEKLFNNAEKSNDISLIGKGSNVMAEVNFNKEKELLLSKEYNCYWFYDKNLGWNRFNKIEIIENGYKGFKEIRNVREKESDITTKVPNIQNPIYMVFLLCDQDENFKMKNEYQRQYVKITWN